MERTALWGLVLLLAALACSERSHPRKARQDFDAAAVAASAQDAGDPQQSWRLANLGDAFSQIIELEDPRALGVGEVHKLVSSKAVLSALARFTSDVVPVLAERHVSELVLESWAEREQCGASEKQVNAAVREQTERPPETESELTHLLRVAAEKGMGRHGMTMSCAEYNLLLADAGGVDYAKLLSLITDKLGSKALDVAGTLASEQRLVIYGGALHNDVYPAAGLDEWSYAAKIAKATGERYVEVDVYVPELVADDKVLGSEWWFDMLDDAHLDRGVILVRRGPKSFVVLARRNLTSQTLAPR